MSIILTRDTVEEILALLSRGFNFEGDVFGISHNTACDVVNELERLLEEDKGLK
jgi:hypothetical protein